MKEDGWYRCRWKQTENGFVLWIPGFKFTKIEADDLDAGCERISELMLEHGVCAMAVLELTPRPPIAIAAKRYATPEIYTVIGDDACYTNSFDAKQLFNGTWCKRCNTMSGTRNERTLTLDMSIRGDGGFGYSCCRNFHFYSSEFLNQLTSHELAGLAFKEIKTTGRRKFYELIGPTDVQTVAVRSLKASGWHCPDCGAKCFGYWIETLPIREFVARSSLPRVERSVFTVSDSLGVSLAMTAQRWDELRDLPRTRGLISRLVGVVDDDAIESPLLQEAEKGDYEERARRMREELLADWEEEQE